MPSFPKQVRLRQTTDWKPFNDVGSALTKAQKELAEAEDKWLELEVLREEIEQA